MKYLFRIVFTFSFLISKAQMKTGEPAHLMKNYLANIDSTFKYNNSDSNFFFERQGLIDVKKKKYVIYLFGSRLHKHKAFNYLLFYEDGNPESIVLGHKSLVEDIEEINRFYKYSKNFKKELFTTLINELVNNYKIHKESKIVPR